MRDGLPASKRDFAFFASSFMTQRELESGTNSSMPTSVAWRMMSSILSPLARPWNSATLAAPAAHRDAARCAPPGHHVPMWISNQNNRSPHRRRLCASPRQAQHACVLGVFRRKAHGEFPCAVFGNNLAIEKEMME